MNQLNYDLLKAIECRDNCLTGISTGNWIGYSDALVTRKERLKEYNQKVIEIQSIIYEKSKTGKKTQENNAQRGIEFPPELL